MTALKTEITTKEQAIGAVPDTAALEQERARLDQGQGRRGELVKAVETAKKRIEHLTKQLAETPAVSGEPDSLGALRERIRRGEASLTGSRDLNQRIDAYAAYREQASALEREVFDLEVLCDKLGPKGIREGLIGARLGALQAEVNRVLGAFGLQVEYVAEPWEVRVNASSGPGLGKAEAFRAGVAHQVALAHVTGVRFLQVDGLDILDTGNRAAFFGVLDFAVTQKLIDQALVYATYTKEPKPSSIPWAKFFLVEYAGDSTAIRPLAA